MRRTRMLWFLLGMVASCAAPPPMPDLPATHPASVDASEAPLSARSTVLSADPSPIPAPGPHEGHSMPGMDMPGMKHGGGGR